MNIDWSYVQRENGKNGKDQFNKNVMWFYVSHSSSSYVYESHYFKYADHNMPNKKKL